MSQSLSTTPTLLVLFASLLLCLLTPRAHALKPKWEWEFNPLMSRVRPAGWERLRKIYDDIQDNGCDTNLVFLLEGTDAISEAEFADQKNFADLIVAITTTDSGGNYAASVYNRKLSVISGLTGNRQVFVQKLQSTQQPVFVNPDGQAWRWIWNPLKVSNLFRAVLWGSSLLRSFKQDANKIILFNKKNPTIIRHSQRWLNIILDRFYSTGNGSICAIALNEDNRGLLELVTRDSNKVLLMDEFFDLSEIIIGTVYDVCQM